MSAERKRSEAGAEEEAEVSVETSDTQAPEAVVEASGEAALAEALAKADENWNLYLRAAAELENVLVNAGPLTVFAPTDEAFAALPEGTLDELLKPENKSALARIVTSHAAPGKFTVEMLQNEAQLYQATGHYVDIEIRDGQTYVAGARILASVEASNGIVHVVDQVFLIAAE